jgi:arsenate reductase
MTAGFLKRWAPEFEILSAGTKPEEKVNPYAVQVMKEEGIDISNGYPKSVNLFTKDKFDYVITVCDGAKEVCPVFTGEVKHRLHIGFEDPADAKGTPEEILPVYRKVRDQIREQFSALLTEIKAGNN